MFDGQKWEFVTIKKCNISIEQVLYLENDLVSMAQSFTFSLELQICLV